MLDLQVKTTANSGTILEGSAIQDSVARMARMQPLLGEEASEPVKRNIEIRWSLPEDVPRIAELLELNGMPRRTAFEDRFIVAEKEGHVPAALRYRTEPKRLLLGLLLVDPWAGERALAVALYIGAGKLAREMGAREVRARTERRADYPSEAGYRRRIGGWRLDVARAAAGHG